MRPWAATLLALMALLLGLALGAFLLETQPKHHGQLRNACWPHSVEIAVRDR